MLSDANAAWSQENDVSLDLTKMGLGVRTTRFAVIVKDGIVTYFEKESNPGAQPQVSDAQTILSKL